MDIGEIIENLGAQNARLREKIVAREREISDMQSQIGITFSWIDNLKERAKEEASVHKCIWCRRKYFELRVEHLSPPYPPKRRVLCLYCLGDVTEDIDRIEADRSAQYWGFDAGKDLAQYG